MWHGFLRDQFKISETPLPLFMVAEAFRCRRL